ncbi:MAG: ABC transporter substrate-binding protein [Calditrichaeota bacterium]|nr:ABC transporter substrate-binding protein [Calditrichota bacterium]
MPIRLAYSPDSDDLFMFYAILEKKIDTGDFQFTWQTSDTESLNQGALNSDVFDVTAISIHNYAYLADRFILLPHGGSVGVNYGPVLVAKSEFELDQLTDKRIAVPGLTTTAYLVLKMICKSFREEVVPIQPFSKVFDEIKQDHVDAGLVIHEGRLNYESHGLKKIIDIGEWWYKNYQLPLPLGGNVIRRSLGTEVINQVSEILRQSIRYALDHKDEAIQYLIENDPRKETFLKDKNVLNTYLDMYANEQTYDYGEDGRKAVQVLLDEGYNKGIIPHLTQVEFSN